MFPKQLIDHLFATERVSLRRFLLFKLRDQEDAEDVVQEAYLRLRTVNQESVVANPRALLFRVASNLAIDRIRQRKRIAASEVPQVVDAETGEQPYMSEAPSPEDSACATQQFERALQTLRALPPKCQRVFVMHKFEGLSYSQIALHLGISKKTVEYHMTQALLRFTDE